jgi:hypothetical protein
MQRVYHGGGKNKNKKLKGFHFYFFIDKATCNNTKKKIRKITGVFTCWVRPEDMAMAKTMGVGQGR